MFLITIYRFSISRIILYYFLENLSRDLQNSFGLIIYIGNGIMKNVTRYKILALLVIVAFIFGVGLVGYIPTTTPPCSFDPDHFMSQSPELLPIFRATKFVQPNNQRVQKTLKEILENKSPFESDLQAIRNWVATNIQYESDPQKPPLRIRIRNWITHLNHSDYWHYPEETIKNRKGDCEDFAILLCSLLRAYGYSPEEVYVVLGIDSNDTGHAFVVLKEDGKWRYIEPQALRGWFNYEGWDADRALNEYKINFVLNDRDFSHTTVFSP